MPDDSRQGFLDELKRRNVHRVAFAYVVGAWALIQVAETIFPYIGLPDRAITFVIVTVAIGLAPALIVAWVYQITPDGVVRDDGIAASTSVDQRQGLRTFDYIVIAVLTVLVALFAFNQFSTDGPPVESTPALAGEPSIAVLPFDNRSGNPDDVYFVEGIHDDIISSLGKIGAMKVIARTSVERIVGSGLSIADIGAELGVTTLLEGSVQRAGDRVRINVRLIDIASETSRWAGNFERELTTENVFAIQSEISQTVAGDLKAVVSADERSRIERVPTDSLEAYQLYLLGSQRIYRRVADSIEEGIGYFEQAIKLDPAFALAYVGLADGLNLLPSYDANKDPADYLAPALAAANKALLLDPSLGEAYASLGSIYLDRNTGDDPEPFYKRAIELSPNSAIAHRDYALYVGSRRGGVRIELALEMLERAISLDPLSPDINVQLGTMYRRFDRLDDAERRFRRAIDIDPGFGLGHRRLAGHYFQLGRYADAYIAIDEAIRLTPDDAGPLVNRIVTLVHLGDFEGAQREIDRVKAELPFAARRLVYPQAVLDIAVRDDAALERAKAAVAAGTDNQIYLGAMVGHLNQQGNFEGAMELATRPVGGRELDPDNMNDRDYLHFIWQAEVHMAAGRVDDANALLDKVEAFLEPRFNGDIEEGELSQSRLFELVSWADFVALRGDREAALAYLRTAADAGWLTFWFFFLSDGHLYWQLKDEPEFIAVSEEIRSKIDAQLARVHAETGGAN